MGLREGRCSVLSYTDFATGRSWPESWEEVTLEPSQKLRVGGTTCSPKGPVTWGLYPSPGFSLSCLWLSHHRVTKRPPYPPCPPQPGLLTSPKTQIS